MANEKEKNSQCCTCTPASWDWRYYFDLDVLKIAPSGPERASRGYAMSQLSTFFSGVEEDTVKASLSGLLLQRWSQLLLSLWLLLTSRIR